MEAVEKEVAEEAGVVAMVTVVAKDEVVVLLAEESSYLNRVTPYLERDWPDLVHRTRILPLLAV